MLLVSVTVVERESVSLIEPDVVAEVVKDREVDTDRDKDESKLTVRLVEVDVEID